MKPVYLRFAISILISLGLGALAMFPVINSENGYVAGFVFLPALLLLGLVSFVLLVTGIITITRVEGPLLLISALMLPTGFFGMAFIAKNLELGAYREDPMVPMTPEIGNIVLFKKGTTEGQISSFWNETLATKREDGRGYEHLPGLRGIGRLSNKEGYEVIEFDFFDNATDEQREYVYSRVRSSPIVFELLVNVPTKDYMPGNNLPSNDRKPKAETNVDKVKTN